MPQQQPPPNQIAPQLLIIDRAIRELQTASGFGEIVLTFKDNLLVEVRVAYTKKVKPERFGQLGSD